MFKNFLTNDKDGFSIKDFEKLILGILTIIIVGTICYKYCVDSLAKQEMIWLAGTFGTLFVARKGLSYFKPGSYSVQQSGENTEFVDSK